MNFLRLTPEETAASGYTHKWVLTHEDLTEGTDNTAQELTLCALNFGDVVSQRMSVQVVTAFSGGSVATCTAQIGVTGTADQFLGASSIMEAAYTCYVPAATVTDYCTPSGGTNLIATFTPDENHDLEDLTAGELHIFAAISAIGDRLSK